MAVVHKLTALSKTVMAPAGASVAVVALCASYNARVFVRQLFLRIFFIGGNERQPIRDELTSLCLPSVLLIEHRGPSHWFLPLEVCPAQGVLCPAQGVLCPAQGVLCLA